MGIIEFRENIALKLFKENSIHCSAANILVTAGAKQAFIMICLTLLEPGDEIIVLNPSYVSFIPQLYISEPDCKIIQLIQVNQTMKFRLMK